MLHTVLLFTLAFEVSIVRSGHYKGGTITWKPTNAFSNASLVEILISEKHSYTRTGRLQCNQTTINNQLAYLDGSSVSAPSVACQSGSSLCSASRFTNFAYSLYCTDFSFQLDSSTGAYYTKQNISRTANIDIAYTSSAWAAVILTPSGAGASLWYVGTHITLGTVYPINASPVTGSLPIIRVIENQTAVIQIPAADWDIGQTLACRFAADNYNGYGSECLDVCGNLPGATISAADCTMTWFAVRRPSDITHHYATSTYVAAIMVEDFAPWISTTTRLSGVPLQMLIYVYTPNPGACSIVPNITGDRPNRACIGVDIGSLVTERVVATVYCSGDSVVEFVTSSPLYMNKTAVALVSGTTNQYYITVTWVPVADQSGPQVFCAAPIDQRQLTGPQYCVNYLVGYQSPELNPPITVQGTASPIGTVFSNQSVFSITATAGVNRPNRNGTYIRVFLASNDTMVWSIDCGWSPNVIYTGTTLIFVVTNPPWVEGETYYVLFDSGAVSGNVFCGAESRAILDKNYWRFNIWLSSRSSTTTTTTTAPTTHTITTRPLSTTTPVANLTTTGIVVTSTSTVTMTTITTTSSTTDSTTTVTTPAPVTTTVVNTVSVISPQDFEDACRTPVAATNAVVFALMLPIHALSMFTLYTKVATSFNPSHVQAAMRNKMRANRWATKLR